MASKRSNETTGQVPNPSDLARHIGFLVRKFYQKNQSIWQELSKDPQITSVQYAVLSVLSLSGPSSLTEIGRAAAMDHATTRGVVERLRNRGMISLEADVRDRRRVIAKLEQPAWDYLKEMEPTMPRIAQATLEPLNPAECLALQFLLLKVTDVDAPKD